MSLPEVACELKWLMLMTCGQRVRPFADLSWSLEGTSPWLRPLLRRKTSHAQPTRLQRMPPRKLLWSLPWSTTRRRPSLRSGGDVYWLGRTHRDRDRYRDTASSFSAKAFYVGEPKLTTGSMHLLCQD